MAKKIYKKILVSELELSPGQWQRSYKKVLDEDAMAAIDAAEKQKQAEAEKQKQAAAKAKKEAEAKKKAAAAKKKAAAAKKKAEVNKEQE